MNFDGKAKGWDSEERVYQSRIIAREIENAIKGETYHKALEFGCGTGLLSFNLTHLLREMTLIDSSEEMIRAVKSKIRNGSAHNISAYKIDVVKGDKLPGKYDLVYMSMSLHHVVKTRKLLLNLSAHLEDSGRICIVDLIKEDGLFHKGNKDFVGHNGFSIKRLASLLKRIGFIDISSQIILSGTRKTEDGDVPYTLFLMTAIKK